MKIISENKGNILLALFRAKETVSAAVKDSKNPFFKSNYADLESCQLACEAPLREAGCFYTCSGYTHDGRDYFVGTIFHVESEEWISSYIQALMITPDMQKLGGAQTYARRYILCGLMDLKTVDDDGNFANGLTHKEITAKKDKEKPKEEVKPKKVEETPKVTESTTCVSEDQWQDIMNIVDLIDEDMLSKIIKGYKIDTVRDLPAAAYKPVMLRLRDTLNAQNA